MKDKPFKGTSIEITGFLHVQLIISNMVKCTISLAIYGNTHKHNFIVFVVLKFKRTSKTTQHHISALNTQCYSVVVLQVA